MADFTTMIQSAAPGTPSDQIAVANDKINKIITAQGLDPADESIPKIVTAIVAQSGNQSAQPAAPATNTNISPVGSPVTPPAAAPFNRGEEYTKANDRYAASLDKIRQRRNAGNIGLSLLTRYDNTRVDRNNDRLDKAEIEAGQRTLGQFDRDNTVNTQNVTEERANTKYGQEQALLKSQNDPTSDLSTNARDVLREQLKTLGYDSLVAKIKDNMSFAQLQGLGFDKMLDNLLKSSDIKAKNDLASATLSNTKFNNDRNYNAGQAQNTRVASEKYTNDTKDVNKLLDTIKGMETIVQKEHPGFTFDSPNASKTDVPGKTVPGLGSRLAMGNDNAKDFEAQRLKLLDFFSRAQTGAVISPSEEPRFREILGESHFRTEADTIKAIGRFKHELNAALDRYKKAAGPDVTDRLDSEKPIRTGVYRGKTYELDDAGNAIREIK